MNRWIKLTIFVLSLTLATRYYGNGHAFLQIFLHGGKEGWRCEGVMNELTLEGVPFCKAQKDALKDLWSIMAGCELVGSVAAGFLMDYLGPRIAALVGFAGQIVAVLLFVLDRSDAYPFAGVRLLPFACIIGGLAINCIANTAFALQDDFPASLAASITIGAQSLASSVLPVMVSFLKGGHMGYTQIWLTYLITCIVPATVIYPMCLPASTVLTHEPLEEEEETCVPTVTSGRSTMIEGLENVGPIQRRSNNLDLTLRKSMSLSDALETVALEAESALSALFSLKYVLVNLVNIGALTIMSYFCVNMDELTSPGPAQFYANWTALQAAYVLVWGAIADAVGGPPVMLVHFLGYAVVYLLSLMGSLTLEYLAVNVFMVLYPFSYAMKYAYIMDNWPSDIHGTLFGVSGGLSGCLTVILSAIAWLGPPKTVAAAMPFAAALFAVPVAGLWVLNRPRRLKGL